jgi:hypothetical protein
MEYRDKTFENRDVLLDGNVYTGCTFRNCRLLIRGEQGGTLGVARFKEPFTLKLGHHRRHRERWL